MVFLEKNKKGRIYWYATERKMVNGVVKRTWQKYPGTAEKIVEMKKKIRRDAAHQTKIVPVWKDRCSPCRI